MGNDGVTQAGWLKGRFTSTAQWEFSLVKVTPAHPLTGEMPFAIALQEDPLPLAFYVHDAEIISSLGKTLESQAVETEKVLDIIYQPQAIFKVRAVTRCTSSLEGHSEAVISVAFSPTGK